MRLILCAASVLIASSSFAGVPNDLLYMQAPAAGAAFISSTGPGGDFTFDDRRRADNIGPDTGGLPLAARVFRIDWWGGDESNAPSIPLSNIASFNIRAYDSNGTGGAPGNILFDRAVNISATNPTATGGTVGLLGAPEFYFSYVSNTGPLFFANASWISIAANYNAPPGFTAESFQWSGSLMGDDLIAQDTFNGQGFQLATLSRRNAAFALYGAVPTPGAAALLGLAGAMGMRRRR